MRKLLVIWACMSFFAGPLYAHKVDKVSKSDTQPDGRTVMIHFSGKVKGDLPVTFTPTITSMRVELGRKYEVAYAFKNKSPQDLPVLAVHSVDPIPAGPFFKKLVCFCFEDQKLAANADITMPVVFVVTPKLPAHIKSLNIDYTLYLKKAPNVKPAVGAKYSSRLKKKG